jgi:CRISPR/Cas system-associated endoribonuclease Cas2
MFGKLSSSFASLSRLSNLTSHQGNQFNRIQKGVADGSLTRGEAGGLLAQQGRIAQAEARALADGKLGAGEFRHLRQMQRHASHDIFENRHNGCERPTTSSERASRVEGRQGNQGNRIQNGLSDGSLSASEAGGLMAQQNHIAEVKGQALADGKMDAGEFKELRQLQREASFSIFSARHNCIRG